jgi:hypothetical protein
MRIQLFNCTMDYTKFPYPLGMIRGTLLWDDRGWVFQNLSGRNDSGYVECEGSWRPTTDGGSLLTLNFVGMDVPLEDELREALHPGARLLWNQLRPRGTIDDLRINLRYASARRELSLELEGKKWKRRRNDAGRSISVQPTWFPYRLDDVAGTIHYVNGHVQLKDISAVHNDTEISLRGSCHLQNGVAWSVHLDEVIADHLHLDRDLMAALPAEIGGAASRLNLRGDISMQGSLDLAGRVGDPYSTTAAWDVTWDVENGSLQCGPCAEHIHGDVRLTGTRDQRGFHSRGELNVDSLVYRGVQVTQIRGPMLLDSHRVVFGAEAERDVPDRAPRAVTADVIGGALSLDAAVSFDEDVPFVLEARLERGDLAELARGANLKNKNIHGRANAVVSLSGNRYGWPSWRGNGAIRLYEADIYEIPVMLALLKLLTIRRPDTTAFTSSEIDFRLQGGHVYLDPINFNGDAISLRGRGEMNLDRQVRLTFYTLVGRRELNLPALKTLLQQASQQLLLIYVTGTLDRPHLTSEPLPMLGETLDQIFPEAAGGDRLSRLPPLHELRILPGRR